MPSESFTNGGFSLLAFGQTPPPRTHSFLKCEKDGVEKGKCFNQIELDNSDLKDKLNFQNSFFICKELLEKSFPDPTSEKLGPIIFVQFIIWTKEENEWFQVDCPIKECLELKYNPFNLGMYHHGRRRTTKHYLSLIFKFTRTDFLRKLPQEKRLSKNREINIYLQVILTNEKNETFMDYIDIPFRKRKDPKKETNYSYSVNNPKSKEQIHWSNSNKSIPTEHATSSLINSLSKVPSSSNYPYFLNSITPTEGNNGDVISLEGRFPPQGQFQIVFGLHIIEPALYFEQKVQCVVPNGRPGQSVTIFVIFNNGELSQIHHFRYVPQNDSPISILKVLNEEKGAQKKDKKAKKRPLEIESSNNQEQQSKIQKTGK